MALPQGINFRDTAGYVTDGTNEDYSIVSRGAYPWTTAQGNNVGWESTASLAGRDRNSGNDRRLAGLNFQTDGEPRAFRIDVSAGNYKVGIAAGDANYAQAVVLTLFDGGDPLIVPLCNGSTSGANQFKDATNTEYSAANWPTSQTLVDAAITSGIVRFFVNDSDPIAHAYIEEVVAGSTPTLTRLNASPLRWR